MAFELKEYVGAVALNVKSKDNEIALLSEGYTQTYIDENSLMVDIEGIHSIITRNDTYYAPDCLKESVPYWTSPYERPVIMHHNERDGKIIGRIKSANYISKSERSGTAALEFVTNIGDEEGKTGIKNGTLATVSIGAIAHDIRCSICNRNLVEEGLCEHSKGEIYDGKRCYWIVKRIEPKELSFVIVPSDIYAHSTRVYPAVKKNKNNEVNESMAFGTNNIFADLIESTKAAIAEGSPLDEEVKDGENANQTGKVEEENKQGKEEGKTEGEEGKKDPEQKPEETPEQKDDEKNPKNDEGEEKPKEDPKSDEGSKEGEVNDDKTNEGKDKKTEGNEIKELKAEIEKLKAENASLKKSVEVEKKLKESAEVELVKVQQERKVDLVERVNKLRTDIGLKAQDVASLMESSVESLQVSLKTYTECKESNLNAIRQMSVIESPVSVSDERDNTIVDSGSTTAAKNLKESVDFKAKLGNIFGLE